MSKRRIFTPKQKTQIVLEVIKEEHTIAEIAAKHKIQPNQISRWRTEFLNNANRAFSKEDEKVCKIEKEHSEELEELYKQIGQLTVECNWLKKKSEQFGLPTNSSRNGK
jgi:transposase-like protein